MNRFSIILVQLLVALVAAPTLPSPGVPGEGKDPADLPVHFTAIHVYIDPHGHSLAAYQFELSAQGGQATLVGIEGGEQNAYTRPPYYDPRANLQRRIVIAAFNTGDDLPTHRTRVATVMVQTRGSPTWSARLVVAAGPDAKHINADISVSEGAAP